MSSENVLRELLERRHHGTLATLKRDGLPQLSNVAYAYDDGVIRISTPSDTAKARNLRRDSRVVIHVSKENFYGYVAAECTAALSDVTTDPHDAVGDELVEVYRAIAGEHPDWEEFRQAMVEQRRLVLRLTVGRLYGWVPG